MGIKHLVQKANCIVTPGPRGWEQGEIYEGSTARSRCQARAGYPALSFETGFSSTKGCLLH